MVSGIPCIHLYIHFEISDNSLRAINVGDSGFLLCRQSTRENNEWKVIYESPHQTHYFNCPYQLGHENGDLVCTKRFFNWILLMSVCFSPNMVH